MLELERRGMRKLAAVMASARRMGLRSQPCQFPNKA